VLGVYQMAISPDKIKKLLPEIFEQVAQGTSIVLLLKKYKIPFLSFYPLLDTEPALRRAHDHAQRARAEAMAAEIEEMSVKLRESERRTVKSQLRNGRRVTAAQVEETTTYDNVERTKLMVDTRKWLMARLYPKKFGERFENTIQGGDTPVSLGGFIALSIDERIKQLTQAANQNKEQV